MKLADLTTDPVGTIRKDMLYKIFPPDFVDQLETTQPIPLADGEDVYTIIEPQQRTKDDLVVIIGGFSQGIQAYADELYDLYKAGYKTQYVNPIKGDTCPTMAVHTAFADQYNVPLVVLRKVVAIETAMRASGEASFHIIGHSQGGMLGAHVAALEPMWCKTLTMVAPEGFQSEQPAYLIATKFAHQATDQMFEVTRRAMRGEVSILEPSGRAGRTFMREFFQKDLLWRLTDEIPEGIKVDLAPILKDLKHEPIHVTLLNAHSDRLFTAAEYAEYLEHHPAKERMGDPFELIDQWAMFSRPEAGHTALGIELPGVLQQVIAAHS